ncbi:MAG: MarR family transcriptional regulator [Chloroflexota bacterium]
MQHGILQILSISTHTSSELSRMMMLDPSTLVPVVDSLEQKGLIQRSIDPKDRRRTPLVLTEQGIEALRRIAKSSEADPLMTSLQMLGQENAEQLLALLTDVLRHMPDGEAILARLDQAEKGE